MRPGIAHEAAAAIRALGAVARVALRVVLVVLALYALKPSQGDAGRADDPARPLRVALFVNGSLGDKSFYDSAARGLQQAQAELGLRARVVEAGVDPTRWESAFVDVVEAADFDIVVTGGFAMVALVQRVAPRFPGTRFIVFDAAVDYAACACANVHSLLFRQNEGAYLAGLLAARMSRPAVGAAPPPLGVVGAMQIPVIDDFIVGFSAGAQAAQPGVRVLRQYVNSFTDPATAKEIAKALYGQGAALIFHAAAGSGQGVIEAAAEAARPAIGVDSDQYALFKTASPARARFIVTSVLKNVDAAMLGALRQHRQGRLPYGQAASLGLAEGGVALATGAPLMDALPPQVMAEVAQAQRDVISGAVRVPSAFTSALAPAFAPAAAR